MTQNDLFTLIRTTVTAGLTRFGVTGFEVQRSYQWIKQGAPFSNAVFFFPITDHRVGSPKQSSKWGGTQMQDTQKQIIESTFQVFARVNMGANGATVSPTASDVTHLVADVFMSDLVIMQLQAQNVGVLRVTDVVNTFEDNDKDRHEQVPFFEITLSYTNTRESIGAPIEFIEPGIHRV
jgi:hypothetical protein